MEQKYFDDKIEDFLENILDNKSDYLEKKQNLKRLNYQNTWINVNQKILKNKDDFFKKKKNLENLNYQNTWNNVNQNLLDIINEN
mgnify:CR=1 FL=1